MALMEISVVPLGTCSKSFRHYVAEIHHKLRKLGVKAELTDMGTIIEGTAESLFKVANLLHETPFEMGEQRVLTVIKLDDRRDRQVSIGEKKNSVIEIIS